MVTGLMVPRLVDIGDVMGYNISNTAGTVMGIAGMGIGLGMLAHTARGVTDTMYGHRRTYQRRAPVAHRRPKTFPSQYKRYRRPKYGYWKQIKVISISKYDGIPLTYVDKARLRAKHKELVDSTILKKIKKKPYIVHGAQTLNKQLPPDLHRHTNDWDLWSKNPKKAIEKFENRLDEAAQADVFYIDNPKYVPGIETYVYRVVSRITGEPVVDIMQKPDKKNIYTIIDNIKWQTLEHAKEAYKGILSNPNIRHRWSKAKHDLKRIQEFERRMEKGEHDIDIRRYPSIFRFAEVRFAPVHLVRPRPIL